MSSWLSQVQAEFVFDAARILMIVILTWTERVSSFISAFTRLVYMLTKCAFLPTNLQGARPLFPVNIAEGDIISVLSDNIFHVIVTIYATQTLYTLFRHDDV